MVRISDDQAALQHVVLGDADHAVMVNRSDRGASLVRDDIEIAGSDVFLQTLKLTRDEGIVKIDFEQDGERHKKYPRRNFTKGVGRRGLVPTIDLSLCS